MGEVSNDPVFFTADMNIDDNGSWSNEAVKVFNSKQFVDLLRIKFPKTSICTKDDWTTCGGARIDYILSRNGAFKDVWTDTTKTPGGVYASDHLPIFGKSCIFGDANSNTAQTAAPSTTLPTSTNTVAPNPSTTTVTSPINISTNNSKCGKIDSGFDRNGNDFASSKGSIDTCCDSCLSKKGCVSWAWVCYVKILLIIAKINFIY